jgi:hypothetical protein
MSPVGAQSAGSASVSGRAPEEVIVRGQRLPDLRMQVESAKVRVYDLFNALNSDDAFDVSCDYEDSTGSRMRQHVCRPRFKTDIATDAARQWRHGLMSACGGVTQECIFSEGAQQAMSMAQAEESREAHMQRLFTQELARAVLESEEIREAILDFQDLERRYAEARGRSR